MPLTGRTHTAGFPGTHSSPATHRPCRFREFAWHTIVFLYDAGRPNSRSNFSGTRALATVTRIQIERRNLWVPAQIGH
jgi:hypothetical protein